MPDKLPKTLKGFEQHGVRWHDTDGDEARGACPFCGGKGRSPFTANVETFAWHCHKCGREGGFMDFLSQRVEVYAAALRGLPADRLSGNRGVSLKTLQAWSVGWSQGRGRHMIPVRELSGKVCNVHCYEIGAPKDKRMVGTSGGKNGLMFADPERFAEVDTLWVCEGEWDAMAMDDALRGDRREAAVVGVPGAASAGESLAQVGQGKHVILAFDKDEGGERGEERCRGVLEGRALTVRSVRWPDTAKPKYDVRDMWLEHDRRPRPFLKALEKLLVDEPPNLDAPPAAGGARPDFPSRARVLASRMEGDGLPRDEIIKTFRKWLYLPDAEVLDVMFGAVLANRLDGDPLWMFIVGPPGCGKSELLMSLTDCPLVVTRTTVTRAALVSGRASAGPDPSLLPKLDGQVLVVKDFTTILKKQEQDREELFGVLRDAYDGRFVAEFGGGELRNYKTKFGMVVGVTPEIEKVGPGHTVAGERFLKYYMRHSTGRVDVGRPAAERAILNRPRKTEMQAELNAASKAALVRAMPGEPTLGEHEMRRILGLAQWTAAMRGAVTKDKYTREMLFKPTTEVATRLSGQMSKLAAGMAIFRGKARITSAELMVLAHVARDTAPDINEEMVRQMYVRSRDEYALWIDVARWCHFPEELVQARLADLEMLGLVQRDPKTPNSERWRLTRTLVRMMVGLDLYAGEKTWQGS